MHSLVLGCEILVGYSEVGASEFVDFELRLVKLRPIVVLFL